MKAKWSAPSTTAFNPRAPALSDLRASGVSALGLLVEDLEERGKWGTNGELKAARERVLPCPVAHAAATQHPRINPALEDRIFLGFGTFRPQSSSSRNLRRMSTRESLSI
jgi:hypothetical protein